MDQRIVVGIDGSRAADAALDRAADDAARRGRALRIVHVREPWAGEHPFTAASAPRPEPAPDGTGSGGTARAMAAGVPRASTPDGRTES
ncbi:universal stress protein [Nonomuraea gerenzanensis]|uniref:Universal stress protein family n=1 Tax=Nonomuraea gerenzanensis TaxID=93944 RepID=A0A1M4EEM4_9ACTN|nr:universal stress protein [Nonomuraea gerenzanensis]SBO97365.1 Universal stress protein family [Nonomuraea gerenzanensis]